MKRMILLIAITIFSINLSVSQDIDSISLDITLPRESTLAALKLKPIERLFSDAGFCELKGYDHDSENGIHDFTHGLLTSGRYKNNIAWKTFCQLAKDDAIGYLGLEDSLDTPLKRKRFREDPKYKNRIEPFEKAYNFLINQDFYYIQPIKPVYDLNLSNFTFKLPEAGYEFQSNNKSLITPQNLITTKIDEETAYIIETSPCNLVYFGKIAPKSQIKLNVSRVCIYNANTGEIYYDYKVPEKVYDDRPYDHVEQMPQFPGGDAAMLSWISSHIRYPADAHENNIQGRVTVRFVVTKNGTVGQTQIVRSKDPSLDKEAIRVVKSLPKFTPGKHDGVPVNVWYTVPVTFKL